VDARKAFDKNPTFIYDKISQKALNREELPKLHKERVQLSAGGSCL
jgi:hypothetical protein